MTKKTATSIQRDQRVLRHSIVGAFWGWLSTYALYMVLVFLVYFLNAFLSTEQPWFSLLDLILIYFAIGVGSFFVTFAGWLCLGFPIAAVITDRQARSFRFMIPVHTIATELALVVPALLASWFSTSERSFSNNIGHITFLDVLFHPLIVAASIGIIGGAVFCGLERRSYRLTAKAQQNRAISN